jgi:hypothetical protein
MINKNTIWIYGIAILTVLVIIRALNFNTNLNRVINVVNVLIIVGLFLQQQELLIENVKSIFRVKK